MLWEMYNLQKGAKVGGGKGKRGADPPHQGRKSIRGRVAAVAWNERTAAQTLF